MRPIQYSRKPRQAYQKTIGPLAIGSAASPCLKSIPAWNLAYLSFDFDRHLHHPDPNFAEIVHRTCRTKIDGSPIAPYETIEARELLSSLLILPAARFVYLVQRIPALRVLPTYRAYGDAWLRTIEQRSRLCVTDRVRFDPILDLTQAQELLSRFMVH